MDNLKDNITSMALASKDAFSIICNATTYEKNFALNNIAKLIIQHKADILSANEIDIKIAKENKLESALIDRLLINSKIIDNMIKGIDHIISLQDPVGEIKDLIKRPSGILVGKMSCPLGVIGVIYESRPNVTIDVACLCLKSGNCCILRGGSESINSNKILVELIKEGLKTSNLPQSIVSFIDNVDRSSVDILLGLDKYIDVIIPRGGKGLIKKISKNSSIPVIKHLDGVCHVYIDKCANLKKAYNISLNAKTSRYATCNTMETLLLHKDIPKEFLISLFSSFKEHGIELRVCDIIYKLLNDLDLKLATEEDWFKEYLAPILSVKMVSSLDEAIWHINYYGSHHTDSIITNNYENSLIFLRKVDSSSVMVNASTRFADGYEYGLGAEVGISTDKLHVRGPVGLEGLTNKKWVVFGNGEIR